MTLEETVVLLRKLGAAYPSFEVSPARAEVWADLLEPFPAGLVAHAVRLYVREGHEFAPNPGQIAGRIGSLASDEASPEIQAGDAWDSVLQHIRNSGSHADAELDRADPVLGRAVRMVGGWPALRSSSSEALVNSTRPHFLRL